MIGEERGAAGLAEMSGLARRSLEGECGRCGRVNPATAMVAEGLIRCEFCGTVGTLRRPLRFVRVRRGLA
jgi:hypothetical protein